MPGGRANWLIAARKLGKLSPNSRRDGWRLLSIRAASKLDLAARVAHPGAIVATRALVPWLKRARSYATLDGDKRRPATAANEQPRADEWLVLGAHTHTHTHCADWPAPKATLKARPIEPRPPGESRGQVRDSASLFWLSDGARRPRALEMPISQLELAPTCERAPPGSRAAAGRRNQLAGHARIRSAGTCHLHSRRTIEPARPFCQHATAATATAAPDLALLPKWRRLMMRAGDFLALVLGAPETQQARPERRVGRRRCQEATTRCECAPSFEF